MTVETLQRVLGFLGFLVLLRGGSSICLFHADCNVVRKLLEGDPEVTEWAEMGRIHAVEVAHGRWIIGFGR
jgi:hypothetical protein